MRTAPMIANGHIVSNSIVLVNIVEEGGDPGIDNCELQRA